MKLSIIVDPRFNTVLKKLISAQVPAETAFKLKQIVGEVRRELTSYDNTRKALLDKYGSRKEDGSLEVDEFNNVKFSDEAMKAFVESLNLLLSVDVEISSISIKELSGVLISVEELELLEGVITS